jgi:HNH endonuclease
MNAMTLIAGAAVPDYPGYEVLTDGTVRSVARLDSIGRAVRARLLRINTKAGYSQARLYRDGVARALLVHRLVLEAFVGPKGYKPEWIDGNRQNSRLTNLRWVVTAKYKPKSPPRPTMYEESLRIQALYSTNAS